MKKILMICLCCVFFSMSCKAADLVETQAEMLHTDALKRNLPEQAKDLMEDVEPTNISSSSVEFKSWIQKLIPSVKDLWKSALKGTRDILLVVILCAILNALLGDAASKAASVAGLLGICTLCFSDFSSLIGLSKQTAQELFDFSAILIPVLAGAATASGSATTSAVITSGTVIFLRALIWVFEKILAPAVYTSVALALAGGISGQGYLDNIRKTVEKLFKIGLKIFMFAFSAWLSVTGVLSGSADAMALKATKMTVSTVIPVVGGMLSDASETVLTAAGLLKNSVGVFGMLAALSIMAVPLLKLGMHYVVFQLMEFLASAVGMKVHTDFLHAVSSALANLMGIVACCGLMLFLSCVCIVKVAVPT